MDSRALISRLRKTDWDFAGQYSESPFSSIHWYPGRFVSQVPAALIGVLSDPDDLVLDPFVGSGTTLVQAQRLGRRSVGFDINPVACLVSEAKVLAVPAAKLSRIIEDTIGDAEEQLAPQRTANAAPDRSGIVPSTVQLGKWYTPPVARSLSILWELIGSYSGSHRILTRAAFSGILLPVCRETRHWGYVCDNSRPKGNHSSNVLDEYSAFLRRLAAAYTSRDDELRVRSEGRAPQIAEAKVVWADARRGFPGLQPEQVHLVITSPPYFGVTDYVKSQRLSLEWFGECLDPLRLEEIGARSKRHRRSATEEYLVDVASVFRHVWEALRKGGHCIVVVGESASRDSVVSAIRKGLASSSGLSLALDLNRRVSSQRRQAPSVTGEHILVYSK